MKGEADVMQRAHAGKSLRNAGQRKDKRPARGQFCREKLASRRTDLQFGNKKERLRSARTEALGSQKILANFSMFDLSKVNGSAMAAVPSSPILMSPMRPAWIVVPGLPVALPSAMSAAIMVAV